MTKRQTLLAAVLAALTIASPTEAHAGFFKDVGSKVRKKVGKEAKRTTKRVAKEVKRTTKRVTKQVDRSVEDVSHVAREVRDETLDAGNKVGNEVAEFICSIVGREPGDRCSVSGGVSVDDSGTTTLTDGQGTPSEKPAASEDDLFSVYDVDISSESVLSQTEWEIIFSTIPFFEIPEDQRSRVHTPHAKISRPSSLGF